MEKTKSKKNSMPGMNCTGLDVTGICAIIEASAKNGVEFLKFGELEVGFRPMRLLITPEGTILAPEPTISETSPVDPELIVQEQKKVEKESIEEDELKFREEQISELLITDPLRAEELIEAGVLEKDTDGRDDGEAE